MTEYKVNCLKTSDYETWDKFVDTSPQGTLFHKSYWLEASGRAFIIYGCFRDGQQVAGIPIVCKSKFGIKHVSHPQLTPYLGIVFKPDHDSKYVSRISDQKQIAREIAKRLKKDFSSIKISFIPYPVDLQPFIWEEFTASVSYTYLLSLDDLELMWKNMDKKRRNDIRWAEENEIRAEPSNNFNEMLNLVEKTLSKQKGKVDRATASKYDEALSKRNQCISFIAKNKIKEAIAGAYIVWDQKRAYYLLGGANPEKNQRGASALAVWEAIKFTKKELGLSEFDFEGSMIPEIEQFFREFGGILTPRYSVTWRKSYMKLLSFAYESARNLLSRLS
jgi:hypothetical protein